MCFGFPESRSEEIPCVKYASNRNRNSNRKNSKTNQQRNNYNMNTHKLNKRKDEPIVSKQYGQFSEFHVCFCGRDHGNLKFETVRTNKQHICF